MFHRVYLIVGSEVDHVVRIAILWLHCLGTTSSSRFGHRDSLWLAILRRMMLEGRSARYFREASVRGDEGLHNCSLARDCVARGEGVDECLARVSLLLIPSLRACCLWLLDRGTPTVREILTLAAEVLSVSCKTAISIGWLGLQVD